MAKANMAKETEDSKLDAINRVDQRLEFAGAILTLIICDQDAEPSAFARLSSGCAR